MTDAPHLVIAEDAGHGGLQLLVTAGPARFVADEPVSLGGLDLGPTPHDLVGAGLAACTAQTLRLYAKRKDWPLGPVEVRVSHRRDISVKPVDIFDRVITLGGPLDEEQRQRLLEIAELCPVHKLLTAGATIATTLA
ncbi:MAG: OsmC family protein [Caulobacteraceae bacterium]